MPVDALQIPREDGELAFSPRFEEWEELIERNRRASATWTGEVSGVPLEELRSTARRETVAAAVAATDRMGLETASAGDSDGPIVMTGHQPVMYHPGVWAKVFVAARIARTTGGTAIECVVDSDAWERVGLTAPCGDPVSRCFVDLARAPGEASYFASAPAPSLEEIDAFATEAVRILDTLGLPEVSERFSRFCDLLRERTDARNLAEAVTSARRAYESPAGIAYLDVPITEQGLTESFALFAAHVAADARAFASIHNDSLERHRREQSVRSSSHPFPDLETTDSEVELPFWYLDGASRKAVWARQTGGSVDLTVDGEPVARIDPEASRPYSRDVRLAPRAIALTLFNRLAVCDLFVHGAGGASYDVVTEDVCRRFFGVELPAFGAVTLTKRLPMDLPDDTEARSAKLKQRLHRIEHNPDRFLDVADLEETDAERAEDLARAKARLVDEIRSPEADKKALGARIKEVNRELATVLEPLAEQTRAEIAELERIAGERAVLEDRTYPFCLWDPVEILDALP
jgi:hypothetical protein